MANVNYKHLWDKLISDICRDIVKIENLPEKSIEDFWVEGTLQRVLSQMCSLHRLPPDMQKIKKLTHSLFEEN